MHKDDKRKSKGSNRKLLSIKRDKRLSNSREGKKSNKECKSKSRLKESKRFSNNKEGRKPYRSKGDKNL